MEFEFAKVIKLKYLMIIVFLFSPPLWRLLGLDSFFRSQFKKLYNFFSTFEVKVKKNHANS
ncbi:uncharacterized protein METZ01_LOCUS232032 [marine metagenome]|uniref:Uncharacterized protein n=1 Tax=marine metagenome TaxID=408172 RepID=A0A382GVS0_9ZZZZ